MRVVFEKDNSTQDVKHTGSVKALLEKLKINPETVLVVTQGTVVDIEYKLTDNDEVMILSVISGG